MREHNHWRAFGKMLNVFFQPFQLFRAKRSQISCFQVHHVDQPDEMHSLHVKAVPAVALCVFRVALPILFAVIFEHIMLARNKERVLGASRLEDLVDVVKLLRFRQVADVSGVEHELGSNRQRVDLVHGGLERGRHVRIRRLVEPHVAVADLDEAQVTVGMALQVERIAQTVGLQDPTLNHAQSSGASPRHALQKAPAVNSVLVDSVVILVNYDVVTCFLCHHFLRRLIQFVIHRLELTTAGFIPSKRYLAGCGNKIPLRWFNLVYVSEKRLVADSFEELALPLFDRLYNFAHWLTQNRDEAEDLVQETFAKALKGFSSFQPGSNFRAWIYRILRNTFLTSRSGLKAAARVPLDLEGNEESLPATRNTPESILLDRLDQQRVQQALDQLPVHFREILVLCEVEEMSYQEISSTLAIPIGTVMSRLSRARRALRNTLHGSQRS